MNGAPTCRNIVSSRGGGCVGHPPPSLERNNLMHTTDSPAKPDTVTLGVQTTREDDRTRPHILELRQLLAKLCEGPYSSAINEFALILRVGGEMLEFDFEGCEKIRRNLKKKYITVDLG